MLHDKFFPINFEEQLIFQQRNRQSAIFPGTVHFQNDTNPTPSFEDIFPRARKPRENRGRWCEPPFSTGENDKGVPFGSFPALPSPWKQTGGEEASFGMEWKMGSQLKARLASMNRCVFCPLKAHTFVPPPHPDLGASSDFLTFLWGPAHFLRMNGADGQSRSLSRCLIKVEIPRKLEPLKERFSFF